MQPIIEYFYCLFDRKDCYNAERDLIAIAKFLVLFDYVR